jgi:hypothetical protein
MFSENGYYTVWKSLKETFRTTIMWYNAAAEKKDNTFLNYSFRKRRKTRHMSSSSDEA